MLVTLNSSKVEFSETGPDVVFRSPSADAHRETQICNYFIVLTVRPSDTVHSVGLKKTRPLTTSEYGEVFSFEYDFCKKLLQNKEQVEDELFILIGVDFSNPYCEEANRLRGQVDNLRLGSLWALIVSKSSMGWRCSMFTAAGLSATNSHMDFANKIHELAVGNHLSEVEYLLESFLKQTLTLQKQDPGSIALASLQKFLKSRPQSQRVDLVLALIDVLPDCGTELVERQLGRFKQRQSSTHPKGHERLDTEAGCYEWKVARDTDKQQLDDVVERNKAMRTEAMQRPLEKIPEQLRKKRGGGYYKFLEVYGRQQMATVLPANKSNNSSSSTDRCEENGEARVLWSKLPEEVKAKFRLEETIEEAEFYVAALKASEKACRWDVTERDMEILKRRHIVEAQQEYYNTVEKECVAFFHRRPEIRPTPMRERQLRCKGERFDASRDKPGDWWAATRKEIHDAVAFPPEANPVVDKFRNPPVGRLPGIIARFIMLNRKAERKLKTGMPSNLEPEMSSETDMEVVKKRKEYWQENLVIEGKIPQLLAVIFPRTGKAFIFTKIMKTPRGFLAARLRFRDSSSSAAGSSSSSSAAGGTTDVEKDSENGIPEQLLTDGFRAEPVTEGYASTSAIFATVDDTTTEIHDSRSMEMLPPDFSVFECRLGVAPWDPDATAVEFVRALEIRKLEKPPPEPKVARQEDGNKCEGERASDDVHAEEDAQHALKVRKVAATATGSLLKGQATAAATLSALLGKKSDYIEKLILEDKERRVDEKTAEQTRARGAATTKKTGQTITLDNAIGKTADATAALAVQDASSTLPEGVSARDAIAVVKPTKPLTEAQKSQKTYQLLQQAGLSRVDASDEHVMVIRSEDERRRRKAIRNELSARIDRELLPPGGYDVVGDNAGDRYRASCPASDAHIVRKLRAQGCLLYVDGDTGVTTKTTGTSLLHEAWSRAWCLSWCHRMYCLIRIAKDAPSRATKNAAADKVRYLESRGRLIRARMLKGVEDQLDEERRTQLEAVTKVDRMTVAFAVVLNVQKKTPQKLVRAENKTRAPKVAAKGKTKAGAGDALALHEEDDLFDD
ncbi:unnamed protein product [Amoebophrya sp. A25]|nr:unnamed protein product [Amoebophrya sp. A25]|eukprot:GSA25T00007750001.1